MGIKKTHEKISQASVVLLVDEISDSADSINKRIRTLREIITGADKKLIIIINKCDKSQPGQEEILSKEIELKEKELLHFISAKEKSGIGELRSMLGEKVLKERLNSNDVIITNIRHYEALLHVSESLDRVLTGLDNKIPGDLIAIDIRQAIHYLGEISGLITTDEILGNIFKNFCIGK
jgi:tRNA modification GTPase